MDQDIARRVVARFTKGAALIADPEGELRKFRQKLDKWDEYVSDAKKIQGIFSEYNRLQARGHLDATADKALADDLAVVEEAMRKSSSFVSVYYIGEFRELWPLSVTVLQKYSLPPALRKKVEAISRHWATKQQVRKPRLPKGYGIERHEAVVALYLKYIDDLREQLGTLNEAMTKGRAITEGDAEDAAKVKAGPFTLINTGGFPEDVMQSAADAVKKAAEFASTSGLGQVCYGEVNISQKISRKNVLAFYMIEQDELFVRADAKATENHIHNILHELGHRYERKFLKNKSAPSKLYMIIGGRHRDEIRKQAPKKGDTLTDPKTKQIYEVTFISGTTVNLRRQIDPAIVEKIQQEAEKEVLRRRPELASPDKRNSPNAIILENSIRAITEQSMRQLGATPAKIDIEGYYAMKGIDPRATLDFKGFMTPYAATSSSENFAEMFAFYAMGDLPPTQAVLFEQEVLEGGVSNPAALDRPLW